MWFVCGIISNAGVGVGVGLVGDGVVRGRGGVLAAMVELNVEACK
jgi:hypothetical protein